MKRNLLITVLFSFLLLNQGCYLLCLFKQDKETEQLVELLIHEVLSDAFEERK